MDMPFRKFVGCENNLHIHPHSLHTHISKSMQIDQMENRYAVAICAFCLFSHSSNSGVCVSLACMAYTINHIPSVSHPICFWSAVFLIIFRLLFLSVSLPHAHDIQRRTQIAFADTHTQSPSHPPTKRAIFAGIIFIFVSNNISENIQVNPSTCMRINQLSIY